MPSQPFAGQTHPEKMQPFRKKPHPYIPFRSFARIRNFRPFTRHLVSCCPHHFCSRTVIRQYAVSRNVCSLSIPVPSQRTGTRQTRCGGNDQPQPEAVWSFFSQRASQKFPPQLPGREYVHATTPAESASRDSATIRVAASDAPATTPADLP